MTTLETPRVRRTPRIWAIVACVVLAPAAAHAIWDQIEANRLAEDIQALRDRGEPIDLRADYRPLASDGERDASRLYYAAAMLAADSLPPPTWPDPAALPKSRAALVKNLTALAGLDTRTAIADPRLADIDAYVHEGEPQLGLIDRAADLPFTRFSPERAQYSYFFQDLGTLAALSSLRTDVLALRGDRSAVESLRSTVKLTRTVSGVSWITAAGTQGTLRLLLERTDPTASALTALQAAYQEQEPALETAQADSIERWRAQMIENVWPTTARRHFSQRLMSRGDAHGWANDSVPFILLRPWITSRFRAYLAGMDAAIGLVRLPFPARLTEAERRDPDLPPGVRPPMASAWDQRVQMQTHLPIWVPRGLVSAAAVRRVARTIAESRVAVVTLAAERWRRAHDGMPPPSLQALVPQYVATVPQDPFDGQSLRYRRDAAGYTIYSVGPKGIDNGGQLGAWQPDLRFSRPTDETSIGLRVPLRPRT